MAFIYESLDDATTSELKNKISKFQTVLSISRMYVIDREREIIFSSLGGRGELHPAAAEPPNFYALLWKGVGVAFEGYEEYTYVQGGTSHIKLNLTGFRLPQELQDELDSIQRAVEEAFLVYCSTIYKCQVSVAIHFPQPRYL